MSEMKELAHAVAASRMYGMQNPEQALVLMSLCRSKGLDPIEAVERYHIIEGRPSMRADAMQSEFMRQGGRIKWVRSDAEVCSAVFSHAEYCPDGFDVTVTFEELNASGVTSGKYGIKDNWKKFPRQMLRARVISEGVRAVMPSVVVGVYTPEEVQDFGDSKQVANQQPTNEPPPPPAQTPASKTTSRYRPAASVPPVAPPPAKAEPANVTEADFAPAAEPAKTVEAVRKMTHAEAFEAIHNGTAPREVIEKATGKPYPEAPAALEPIVPEPPNAPELSLLLDPKPSAPPAAKPVEPATKSVEVSDVATLLASLPETAPTAFAQQRALATVLYKILEQTDPEAKAAYQCDLRGAANDSTRTVILNKMLQEVKA
jgi:hypothetical protein